MKTLPSSGLADWIIFSDLLVADPGDAEFLRVKAESLANPQAAARDVRVADSLPRGTSVQLSLIVDLPPDDYRLSLYQVADPDDADNPAQRLLLHTELAKVTA